MLSSGIEFLADQGMYHIVLQFWPEAQQCQKVSLSHRGWPKWVNTVLLWLGTPTALILSALALLEPIPKVVESDESFVIRYAAPESSTGGCRDVET